MATGGPGTARAQVAASVTVVSNDLYRGLSLSDGQPAADLTLTYDGAGGVYLGASAVGETVPRRGPRALGAIVYLGHAGRVQAGGDLDVGLQIVDYRTYGAYAGDHDAAEVYAGWVRGPVNAYLHYSPDYFNTGARTLYEDLNGATPLARRWRLFGHAGVLTPLGGGRVGRALYDVRVGVSAAFKGGEAQLSWTTTGPNPGRGGPYAQGAGVVAVGLTLLL